jgi:hypothetical protein
MQNVNAAMVARFGGAAQLRKRARLRRGGVIKMRCRGLEGRDTGSLEDPIDGIPTRAGIGLG